MNERVHRQLENHELDVIVQVRKLGEGFDHPYLGVVAVFSIFNNLGPFMQFFGRVMRVIPNVREKIEVYYAETQPHHPVGSSETK